MTKMEVWYHTLVVYDTETGETYVKQAYSSSVKKKRKEVKADKIESKMGDEIVL